MLDVELNLKKYKQKKLKWFYFDVFLKLIIFCFGAEWFSFQLCNEKVYLKFLSNSLIQIFNSLKLKAARFWLQLIVENASIHQFNHRHYQA
jgi:hypothetical protein